MQPQDIIRRKRDGQALDADEIAAFVRGIGTGEVSEGQIGAFTMAVYLNGMTAPERVALSLAMRDSGHVLDWSGTGIDEKLLIEKHSSGGVGDEKITLLVIPLAAACGVFAPNLSGWGLDYCGGEIDMLDSIPGYDTAPSSETFIAAVKAAGGAIIGPTPDLAPADRKIFKVRDVTATVESVALITGSIMSKKLAAGPRGMVITVGSGSGAYMATPDDARELATSMSEVAAGAGLPSVMLLTDLNAFLGTAIGAATEVIETVDFLTGRHRDARVADLTLTVTAEMIVLAGLAPDIDAARTLAASRLEDGSAARHFDLMVAALGGPTDFVDRPADHLPAAPLVKPVFATESGFVAGMNTREIGLTLVALGGGRTLPEEAIDLSVGLTDFRQIGDTVGPDHPLCIIHARNEPEWQAAAERVRAAVQVTATPPATPGPIVIERIAQTP